MGIHSISQYFENSVQAIRVYLNSLSDEIRQRTERQDFAAVGQMSEKAVKLQAIIARLEAIQTDLDELLSEFPPLKIQELPQPPPGLEWINVPVTQGGINNGYLAIGRNRHFFPSDVFGASSAKQRKGTLLRLRIAGINRVIETDIAEEKGIFRDRKWFGAFCQLF